MPTGDWFVARPRNFFQESNMVSRIARQTDNRVYYGDTAPRFGRSAKQSYFAKSECLVIGTDEATARAIAAAWIHARQKLDRANERCREECAEIGRLRDAKIAALAQGIDARSDETLQAAQPERREPDGEAGAP